MAAMVGGGPLWAGVAIGIINAEASRAGRGAVAEILVNSGRRFAAPPIGSERGNERVREDHDPSWRIPPAMIERVPDDRPDGNGAAGRRAGAGADSTRESGTVAAQ
jgi:hypothetical protein